MKFGKRLRTQIEDTLPDWQDKFLNYKDLKKRLKSIAAPECFTRAAYHREPAAAAPTEADHVVETIERQLRASSHDLAHPPGITAEEAERLEQGHLTPEEEEFIRLLNVELEKFNNFFIEKEEEFVIRLSDLKERVEKLRMTCNREDLSTCPACASDVNAIRKAIVAFHGEMVLLENYSSLNYTGLVKILKKHDKRTGMLLRMPYINNVLRQPFYTTELLSKLVRDCEEKLQFVFAPAKETGKPRTAVAPDPLSFPRDEDVDSIYRSTVAALRSLQDIRGSTGSPRISGAPPGNGATLSSLLGGGIGDSSDEEGASEGAEPQADGNDLREGGQNGAQEDGGVSSAAKRARVEEGGAAHRTGGCGVELQKSVDVRVVSPAPEAKREKEEEGGEVAVQA
ncbi:SPX domain containing protein [Klebsormidium nitens]|uniref:SPX domain containing protein n=1 Tax=Klebsormidium nitens TaxID=105231 RepID=A0A1Y1I5A7_KLENI|nr:SPX domain containing protein [Klebsormidium nitens]|eukprot:GAQ83907.1 SPX domain containing protein [Klebsormidium nitens]